MQSVFEEQVWPTTLGEHFVGLKVVGYRRHVSAEAIRYSRHEIGGLREETTRLFDSMAAKLVTWGEHLSEVHSASEVQLLPIGRLHSLAGPRGDRTLNETAAVEKSESRLGGEDEEMNECQRRALIIQVI